MVKCHTKGRSLSYSEFVKRCYLTHNCFIYGLSDYKAAFFSPAEWQQIVGRDAACTSHTAETFWELEINTLAKETLSFMKRLVARVMENNYG